MANFPINLKIYLDIFRHQNGYVMTMRYFNYLVRLLQRNGYVVTRTYRNTHINLRYFIRICDEKDSVGGLIFCNTFKHFVDDYSDSFRSVTLSFFR